MRSLREFRLLVTGLVIAAWSGEAKAFRPFDGTDAAVAEHGKIEIELGPAEYLREGTAHTLFAPSARFNYGFAPDWEAVVEGRVAHGLSGNMRGSSLVEDGAFLKHVLSEGGLQENPGPSIATEFGVLLPEIRGEHGAGASLAGILSQRWEEATVHLNVAVVLTREQHADLFTGVIVEGPHDWTVRPVAEVFYERDFGETRTHSALVGAIWQVKDDVAVDFGLRGARINDHTAAEVRAGITFSLTAQ